MNETNLILFLMKKIPWHVFFEKMSSTAEMNIETKTRMFISRGIHVNMPKVIKKRRKIHCEKLMKSICDVDLKLTLLIINRCREWIKSFRLFYFIHIASKHCLVSGYSQVICINKSKYHISIAIRRATRKATRRATQRQKNILFCALIRC